MNDIIIKVTAGDKTLQLQFPEDCSIEDWQQTFKTILTFATFMPSTIDSIFCGEECSIDKE